MQERLPTTRPVLLRTSSSTLVVATGLLPPPENPEVCGDVAEASELERRQKSARMRGALPLLHLEAEARTDRFREVAFSEGGSALASGNSRMRVRIGPSRLRRSSRGSVTVRPASLWCVLACYGQRRHAAWATSGLRISTAAWSRSAWGNSTCSSRHTSLAWSRLPSAPLACWSPSSS